MCSSSKDYKEFNIGTPIGITNLYEKSEGNYKNLGLSHIILDTDLISFAEFAEEILSMYNNLDSCSERIDFSIDDGTFSRWEVFFDDFRISLYRDGIELKKPFTSNYIYTEFDNHRCFWVDLYYSKENYDSDKVFKDILRELNNFIHRDFKKYLNEEK